MSVGSQALERSVLEGKERDELAAIADALGLKPGARSTKATLIGLILKGAGIETAEPPPKRSRQPRTSPRRNGEASVSETTVTAPETGDIPPGSHAGGREPVDEGAEPPEHRLDSNSGRETDEAPSAAEASSDAPAGGDLGGDSDAGPGRDRGHGGDAREGPVGGQGHDGNRLVAERAGSETSSAVETRPDDRPREHLDRDGGRDHADRDGGREYAGGGPDSGNRRGRRRRGRDRNVEGQEPAFQGDPVEIEGLLDLRDEGYGFLRTSGYLPGARDVYVSLSQVRRFALRKGDLVTGTSRPANTTEKYPALLRIDTVNDMTPDEARNRPRFEALTPLFPDEKLRLEIVGDSTNMTARIVDLISPIGKGQRGLIVSPPKAGKTTVMKQIARSIETNSPEVHLMVLLVDERPEEVTDMRRWVKGEVVASTFDRPAEEHTHVVELAIERAKRLVEMRRDVVIILDGITRLARAYNLAAPATGKVMSGGVDSGALYPPKKFFGAARNMEEGGSLTILATALVETGSRMDEVIFEEFKGTGNMELRLDRKLAERRIYPAIDVEASSTRHEELLFERSQLQQVWKLRRVLSALETGAGLELLMDKIRSTKSNDEFLSEIAKAPTATA